jgi:hypothetical protein
MSETLFLHYDRAALDAEYDNRAKVTGAEDYIARWNARSKEARSELECNLDLAYGPSNTETLDIFRQTRRVNPQSISFSTGVIGVQTIRNNSVTWRTASMRPVPSQ